MAKGIKTKRANKKQEDKDFVFNRCSIFLCFVGGGGAE